MVGVDLPLACDCGAVRGTAQGMSGRTVNRMVCYCKDCRAFVQLTGRGDDILDDNGGVTILQTSPARLQWTAGTENLACLKLSPKGILRWYARCCGSPLCNTPPAPGMPFAGLIASAVDWKNAPADIEASTGPRRGGVHGRYATGDRSRLDANDKASPLLLARVMARLAAAKLRGDHKRSPFFDAEGRPVSVPRVLTQKERSLLEREPRQGPDILAGG